MQGAFAHFPVLGDKGPAQPLMRLVCLSRKREADEETGFNWCFIRCSSLCLEYCPGWGNHRKGSHPVTLPQVQRWAVWFPPWGLQLACASQSPPSPPWGSSGIRAAPGPLLLPSPLPPSQAQAPGAPISAGSPAALPATYLCPGNLAHGR